MIQQRSKCNIDHEKKNNLFVGMHFPIYISESFFILFDILEASYKNYESYFIMKDTIPLLIFNKSNINIDHFHLQGLLKHTSFCNVQCIFHIFIFILPILVKFVCSP